MTISLKEWKFPRQYENVLLMQFFTVYIGAFLNWRYLDHPPTPVYLILLIFQPHVYQPPPSATTSPHIQDRRVTNVLMSYQGLTDVQFMSCVHWFLSLTTKVELPRFNKLVTIFGHQKKKNLYCFCEIYFLKLVEPIDKKH